MNEVVVEIEYESLEAYEKSLAEMLSDPEVREGQKRVRELTERAATQEIWHLAD
jgi:hypothetical protein